ncbi:MAG: hypothetical protein Q9164_006530 [Protoblastenia rupestris]
MPGNSAAPCANPLLLEWIKEIYDAAKERNTKGVTTYKRAYDSMKACPLTFSHPSEAVQLDGIGPKICDRLTEKLKEHCEANGLPAPKKSRGKARKRLSAEDLAQVEEPAPAKKPRKAKPYVPSLRTGPYAIIMALSSLPEDSLQSLTKAQVIELAQSHCESSFTVPSEAGKFYTAWNSMTTLVNKDLVQERGRPLRKYALTEEGWEAARRIRAVEEGNMPSNKTSSTKEKISVDTSYEVRRRKSTIKGIHTITHLEDDLRDLDAIRPPLESHDKPRASNMESSPASSGQRLGGAPMDKFGTFSKNREQPKPMPMPKPNVVELLSSPEPPDIPWSSSTFQQDSRSLATSSSSKALRSNTDPSKAPSTKYSTNPAPTTASSKLSTSLPTFTPIILPPGSFTIRLVLDNREVRTKDDRDYIADQLTLRNAPPLVRPLPLGDIFWVAKLHDSTLLSQHGEEAGDEVALDWIVERKRLDDLVGSITDGRFSEQKFRLRRSCIKNVIYLIEEITLSAEKASKFSEAITSAITSTQVVNNYFVKRTNKLDDSIRYLARLTTLLKSMYENNPLHVIPTSTLSPSTYLPLLTHLRSAPEYRDRNYNITFPAFASLASKNDSLTLRDVYLKMLMCTRGISGDKALAIQKVWATPRALVEGFEACATQKEKDLLVEKRLGGLVGKGKVKGVLGAKVGDVWGVA